MQFILYSSEIVDFKKHSISKTLTKYSPNFSYAEGCFSCEAQKKNEVERQTKWHYSKIRL